MIGWTLNAARDGFSASLIGLDWSNALQCPHKMVYPSTNQRLKTSCRWYYASGCYFWFQPNPHVVGEILTPLGIWVMFVTIRRSSVTRQPHSSASQGPRHRSDEVLISQVRQQPSPKPIRIDAPEYWITGLKRPDIGDSKENSNDTSCLFFEFYFGSLPLKRPGAVFSATRLDRRPKTCFGHKPRRISQ